MNFAIMESRWHGSKYFVVEPKHEYGSIDSWKFWDNSESWCAKTFGPVGDVWTSDPERYYINNRKFFFRHEKDLALFLLKWS